MSTQRRYSDDEVHAIFERAAVRQEEAAQAEDASRAGLSLEELQEIGAEAGIDPAHIALAARELAVRRPVVQSEADASFLGIPTRIGTSRLIRGHVSDEEWEEIVPELRGIFGRDGISGEIGKIREWTVSSSFGKSDRPVKVTLKPQGDDTLVTINQEMRGQAIGLSIGAAVYVVVATIIGLLSVLGTGTDGAPIGVAIMFLAMAVLFFAGSQIGTRVHAKRQRARFDQALDRIELVAREVERATSAHSELEAITDRSSVESRTPQIDLDALPEAEDIVVRRESSSRTRS